MSSSAASLMGSHSGDHKNPRESAPTAEDVNDSEVVSEEIDVAIEHAIRLKIDIRLCTIAGILTSLNLVDSGIISSASVAGMFDDLDLYGSRYSGSIFIFTLASIAFQLPSTIAVRLVGPRLWFASVTFVFGLITICTGFVQTWKEMIALRVLLGISMSSIYPGLAYLISTWYTRHEQQLRFAYLQTGEVFVLACGSILNYGLAQLHGRAGLAGWRWMFVVQGLIACSVGIATYWWIVDFPERPERSFKFLTTEESAVVVSRIQRDRGDVQAVPFSWRQVLCHWNDLKLYGFATMFFLLNLVSTALSYFLPIILQSRMGFSSAKAIILSAPPYFWAIIPVILTSYVSDRFHLRGPIIIFNSICLIAGFVMLGLTSVRYLGVYLATGAYVSNWAALNAFVQNNVVGQWKRVFVAASTQIMNGCGGIAGSFIFRQQEAPRYPTAVWVSIGSHMLMIAFVGAFSLAFYMANRRQLQGKRVIEDTPGFRHTY